MKVVGLSVLLFFGLSCSINKSKAFKNDDVNLVYSNYDSIRYGKKLYALLVYANKFDSLNAHGKIILKIKKNNRWISTDSFIYDNSYYYQLYGLKNDFIDIKFEDINNDGVKDFFFFSGWGARQANEFYRIFLINTKNDRLVPLKPNNNNNIEFFINPYYEKKDSTLLTSFLYGDTVVVAKYKIIENAVFKVRKP